MSEGENPYRAPEMTSHGPTAMRSRWPISPGKAVFAGTVGASCAGLQLTGRWDWWIPVAFIGCGLPILLLIRILR
jgi:hypothetical protein